MFVPSPNGQRRTLLTSVSSARIFPLVLQGLFSGGRLFLLACPDLPPQPKESQVNLISTSPHLAYPEVNIMT